MLTLTFAGGVIPFPKVAEYYNSGGGYPIGMATVTRPHAGQNVIVGMATVTRPHGEIATQIGSAVLTHPHGGVYSLTVSTG